MREIEMNPADDAGSTSTEDRARAVTLDALWTHVAAQWDDERPHRAVIEFASRTENLAELAGRYRALVDDPRRGPMAKRQLDAVVAAATSLLWSAKTPAPQKVPLSITLSAAAICLFLLAWLSWSLYVHR
jgi:hypothetical protein